MLVPKFISSFRQLERQSICLQPWKSKLEDSGRTLAKPTREGFRITVVEFLDDKCCAIFAFISTYLDFFIICKSFPVSSLVIHSIRTMHSIHRPGSCRASWSKKPGNVFFSMAPARNTYWRSCMRVFPRNLQVWKVPRPSHGNQKHMDLQQKPSWFFHSFRIAFLVILLHTVVVCTSGVVWNVHCLNLLGKIQVWFHTFQTSLHRGMFGAGNYFAEDPVLWYSSDALLVSAILWLNMVEISSSDQLNFSRSISGGFFHAWSACHHLSLESFSFSLWVCHELLSSCVGTAAHKCEWNDIDTICFKQPHTHINIYNIFIYYLYRISYFWHTVLLIPSLLQFVG